MALYVSDKCILILLFTVVTCVDEQKCDYVNMEVTGEHGNQNILTVKTINKHHDSCGEPTPQGQQGARLNPASPPQATKHPMPHRTQTFIPTVSFLFGDFIPGCEKVKDLIPVDLCRIGQPIQDNLKDPDPDTVQHYGDLLVENSILPMASGDLDLDTALGYGYILMCLNQGDEAVLHLSSILRERPSSASTFYARGVAHITQGLKQPYIDQALGDLEMASKLSPGRYDGLERIAEMYLVLGLYDEALEKVNKALKVKATAKLLFLSGSINFALDDLLGAEQDFRRAAEIGTYRLDTTLYNLGLTLYHRGKIRNAIEVFKEVIKIQPEHIDAVTTLAQAYRELGNYEKSVAMFNSSKHINSKHVTTLQLLGALRYYSGQPKKALISFDQCLKLEPRNVVCHYLHGLAQTTLGRYYNAIKAFTKAIVYDIDPGPRGAFEALNAHYLREYCRYLHRKLDGAVSELHIEEDFSKDFQDSWVKEEPLIKDYEQPGLQPSIQDAGSYDFAKLSPTIQELVCLAKRVGEMGQVTADGFLYNRRHNLAMGLSAIHIAQHMQAILRGDKGQKNSSAWRELFDIGIQYRRLAEPEAIVVWMDTLPKQRTTNNNYNTYITFIKGHTVNMRMVPYFDMVFKLVKTMVGHYHTESAIVNSGFEEELQAANSFEDLIVRARQRKLTAKGLMVATQVPSLRHKGLLRLDGIVLSLTGAESSGKIGFAIHQAVTENRSGAYYDELGHQFQQLYKEMKVTSNVLDMDPVLNHILLLVYYFYNLMPLSLGNSSVAYSVLLGLILAAGREVTGNIPPGKLVDMEALLAGAPEAFVMAVKEWMQLKSSAKPVSSMPAVANVFPTARAIIEILNSTPVC